MPLRQPFQFQSLLSLPVLQSSFGTSSRSATRIAIPMKLKAVNPPKVLPVRANPNTTAPSSSDNRITTYFLNCLFKVLRYR